MQLFPFRTSLRRSRGVRLTPRVFQQAALGLAAVACFGLAASTAAAQTHFDINAAKSQVLFSLGGFHDVHGVFKVTSGNVTFDRSSGNMSGKIIVSAASGNSGDSARDKKMHRAELHDKKFPHITFQPQHFTGTLPPSGSSTVQVHGLFTLIGKPHKIVVPMTVQVNGKQCIAKGTFTVPYVSWGMKDPTMLFMKEAKTVKINITFKGSLTSGK